MCAPNSDNGVHIDENLDMSMSKVQHDYPADCNIEVQIKYEEQAAYSAYDNDDGMLDELLVDEEEIIIDSDLTMKIFNDVCPMPIKTTSDDLEKRHGDWLSGSMPFNNTVCFLKTSMVYAL